MRQAHEESGAGTPPNIPDGSMSAVLNPPRPQLAISSPTPLQLPQLQPSFSAQESSSPLYMSSLADSEHPYPEYPYRAPPQYPPISNDSGSDLAYPHHRSIAPVPQLPHNLSSTSLDSPTGTEPNQVVGSQGRRGVIPPEKGYSPALRMNDFMALTHEKNEDGKYPCPSCHKTYQNSKHLTRHYYTHSLDRPYECRFCRTIFTRSDVLKRHFNKCAERRGIPLEERGSHLMHSSGFSKKHGRLRRDESIDESRRQQIHSPTGSELPSPTLLRGSHSRDHSGVTDGSYISPSMTASSSRRQSLTSFEDGMSQPHYTAAHGLEQLHLYSGAPMSGGSGYHQPSGSLSFDPTRQDVGYPQSQYYGTQPTQSWNMYSTASSDTSMPAYYPPSTLDPSIANPAYAYGHMAMSQSYSPTSVPAAQLPVKREGEEVYENNW